MIGEDDPVRLDHRDGRIGGLDECLEAAVLVSHLGVLVGQLVALARDRRQEPRVVEGGLDMAPDHSRELEVLVVERFSFRCAKGEGAYYAAPHTQRDREDRDETLHDTTQIGSSLEVVDVDRLTAHDRVAGQTGSDRKAARLRYKTPALPVIQGMNGVVRPVLGDEGDARTPYGEHARQLENGRPKDFVEVEGRVDERRELGDDLEPCDGDASALGAEAAAHRVRSRSVTMSIIAVSCASVSFARARSAAAATPCVSCHCLPNDSRRSA